MKDSLEPYDLNSQKSYNEAKINFTKKLNVKGTLLEPNIDISTSEIAICKLIVSIIIL